MSDSWSHHLCRMSIAPQQLVLYTHRTQVPQTVANLNYAPLYHKMQSWWTKIQLSPLIFPLICLFSSSDVILHSWKHSRKVCDTRCRKHREMLPITGVPNFQKLKLVYPTFLVLTFLLPLFPYFFFKVVLSFPGKAHSH